MPVAIEARAKAVSPDRTQGQTLKFVPILGPSSDQPPYELLRKETLPSVVVTEISQQGSVPELKVQNNLDMRVFLIDGQELVGAKQNRILNTDVLVPAQTTLNIPVSCVEQGRWNHISPSFSPGKAASHRTRSSKLDRVHDSLKQGRRHDANQSAVWNEVAMCSAVSGSSSPTGALSTAYAMRERELTDFRRNLSLPESAVGVAVFQGERFQGMDIFDRHSTLKYFWESLVDSYTIDFLGAPVDPTSPQATDEGQTIRTVLDRLISGTWEKFRSPGEGTDWRMEDPQYAASSLVWEEQVVLHVQVFPKAMGASGDETATYRPRVRRPYGPGRPRG